ncbi:MAG: hypothetical protein ACREDA_06015 [Methylocella sp.]
MSATATRETDLQLDSISALIGFSSTALDSTPGTPMIIFRLPNYCKHRNTDIGCRPETAIGSFVSVPGFFKHEMRQLFEFERLLADQMIPFDRDAL